MEISVIIPAYNEEKNIVATLDEVVNYLQKKFPDSWEIIVVDDKSSDKTVKLVRDYIQKQNYGTKIKLLLNQNNMGKGASVRKGMLEAEGNIVLFMDADNSTKIIELEEMYPLLKKNKADIVIASRKLRDSVIMHKQPLLRRIMSFSHHWLVSLILGVKVSDYNCGFKIFNKRAAKLLFSKQKNNRWVFDAEVLFLAKKYGFRIKEIPVHWEHKHTSKVVPVKAISRSLKELCTIVINNVKGAYK